MTSGRSDASFKAGKLLNHIPEGFFELLLDCKLTFHTLSFLEKKKNPNWAPGAGACVVCACAVSK